MHKEEKDIIVDAVLVEQKSATQLFKEQQEIDRLALIDRQKRFDKQRDDIIEGIKRKLLSPKFTIPFTCYFDQREMYHLTAEVCEKAVKECIPDPDNILKITFQSDSLIIEFKQSSPGKINKDVCCIF
jgi:hypothetical protein